MRTLVYQQKLVLPVIPGETSCLSEKRTICTTHHEQPVVKTTT